METTKTVFKGSDISNDHGHELHCSHTIDSEISITIDCKDGYHPVSTVISKEVAIKFYQELKKQISKI